MMLAVVTFRFPPDPNHDPRKKKTGPCPVSKTCTDVTGEHHSYIESGVSVEQIRSKAEQKLKGLGRGGHVSRIEVSGEPKATPFQAHQIGRK